MLTRLSPLLNTSLGLLFLLVPIIATAGKVIGVPDGNTVVILNGDNQITVRLAYVDAPEKGQAFSIAARRSLAELCLDKDVDYQETGSNQAGNTVAAVSCGRTDAARVQVERGMAWVDVKQKGGSDLASLETSAREGRKGLWADEKPIPPWEYRRPLRRTKAALASRSDEAICFVDRRGEYRIVNGTKRYGC